MPKGNPPGQGLQDYSKNPIHGVGQSKIEFYNLQDVAIDLKKAGCSLQEIQEVINTKYLNGDDQFISIMSLSRWLSKNFDDYDSTDLRKSNVSINEYNELLDMASYSENQLEIAERTLKDIRQAAKETRSFGTNKVQIIKDHMKTVKDKEVKEILTAVLKYMDSADTFANPKDVVALMNSTEKTLARRQSILSDIVKIKEKIFSFTAMQTIIATAMNKVKAKDVELYAEIKNEFNNDPMIAEAFKKIPK